MNAHEDDEDFDSFYDDYDLDTLIENVNEDLCNNPFDRIEMGRRAINQLTEISKRKDMQILALERRIEELEQTREGTDNNN